MVGPCRRSVSVYTFTPPASPHRHPLRPFRPMTSDTDETGGTPSSLPSPATITGYRIRARVSQQASQVGNKEYWSAWKASAKQKAADLVPTVRQWAEAATSEVGTTSNAQTSPLGYATYRPRSNTQGPKSPRLSPKLDFSTSSLVSDTSSVPSNAEIIYPVLLPGYTFTRRTGEGGEELIVTLRGFVARKPAIHGRAQRMFNLMARQLARLPKPLSASSTSLLLNPSATSIDDANFFPSVPQEWASSSPSGATIPAQDQYQQQHLSEKLLEGITDSINEETLGKLVSKLGALPIDGEGGVHDGHNDTNHGREQGTGAHRQVSLDDASTTTPQTRRGGDSGSDRNDTQEQMVGSSNASIAREPLRSGIRVFAPPPPSPSTISLSSTAKSTTASTSLSSAPFSMPSRLTKLKRLTPSRTPSSSSLLTISSNATSAADSQLVGGSQTWASRSFDEIHQLTANLNERLSDFWIYRVALRKVRIEVQGEFVELGQTERSWQTLLAQELKSDLNGMFRLRVNLGPLGVFEGRLQSLRARVVLLDNSTPSTTHAALEVVASPPPSTEWIPLDIAQSVSSHTPIRLISDVDDTIRQTGVVQGLKSVFRQVFVLPHSEVIVPGMADWYHSLAQSHHIGIHFVSNAPIELWKQIKEFLDHAGMPHGHLHLKSYNSEFEGSTVTANAHHQDGHDDSDVGTSLPSSANSSAAKSSLLSTWLQPASARKKAAVVSILDDFPETGFFLVGDTGELDLELYSELARERPNQIKALYLRDVASEGYIGPTSAREKASGEEEEKRSRLAAARKAGEAIKRPVRAFTDLSRASSRPPSPVSYKSTERSREYSPSDATATAGSAYQPRKATLGRASTPAERTLSTPRPADSQLSPASTQPITLSSSIARAKTTTTTATTTTRRSPALQARINKALAILPAQVEIHFFREGDDVRGECERLVRELRGEEQK